MEVISFFLYDININKCIHVHEQKEGEEMRNIVLLCNMGMSTSLMVNKMKATAQEEGYECEISAHALQQAADIAPVADILLIGPQISYELPRLKETYPDKVIEAIDMMDYGRMDGAKVLHHVKEVLGD